MAMGDSGPVRYDPYSPEVQADPYPFYRWLRDYAPVHSVAERDLWVLSRYDDVQWASREWRTFSTASGTDPDYVGKVVGINGFLDMDPPRHDELRKIVRDFFTPAAIAACEFDIIRRADALLESMSSRGEADLATEYAAALPRGVVAGLLGVPSGDLRALTLGVFRCYESSPFELTEAVRAAADEVHVYCADLLDERARAPRDDVVTALARARTDAAASLDEAVSTCLLIFTAGYVTTAGLIGGAAHLLAEHPDERAKLAVEPERLPVAVEEFLRIEPPIQALARNTTRDVELHDTVIPAGARVLFLYGSANHDERRFPDPERLDLGRADNRHLAFGEGVHRCLGSSLARLEGRVAIERLLARMPEYVVTGPVQRVSSPVSREIVSLPVAFAPV
jgi:cytochrome P450